MNTPNINTGIDHAAEHAEAVLDYILAVKPSNATKQKFYALEKSGNNEATTCNNSTDKLTFLCPSR